MATTIPASHADLLSFSSRSVANLSTLMRDGTPQVTPVWCDYDGRYVIVNTAAGRVKERNARRDPRVALAVSDCDNAYRYLGIQGRVVEITEEGADEHIDHLAQKYLGQQRYPGRAPGERRVMLKIQPERVHTMG